MGVQTPEELQLILGIHPEQLNAAHAMVNAAQGDTSGFNPTTEQDEGQQRAALQGGAVRPGQTPQPLTPSVPDPHGVEATNRQIQQRQEKLAQAEAERPQAEEGKPSDKEGSFNMFAPILARHQNELKRLETTGSGVQQFSQKHHLFGPIVRALDIAGSVIAPTAATMIPGTTLHHNYLENQARGRVESDLGDEKTEAANEAQEAETRYRNAQSSELENTTEVKGADGTVYRIPNKDLQKYLSGQNAVAGRERVATIAANNRTELQNLKNDISSGKIKWIKPAVDDKGNAVLAAYNENGDIVKYLENSVGPAWLQPTVRSSVQLVKDENGNYQYVPKTTTTRRMFRNGVPLSGGAQPGQVPPGAPAPTAGPTQPAARPTAGARNGATPRGGSRPVMRGGARPVLTSGGQPLGSEKSVESGYAYDPKSGNTVLTTRGDFEKQGLQNFRPVKQTQIDNDRQLVNRLDDVQAKVEQYKAAVMDPNVTQSDRNEIANIIRSDKLKAGIFGFEIPVDQANYYMRNYHIGNLSDAGARLLATSYNAREAMGGYQRVLSGSSRGSDKIMELNIDALPKPSDEPRYADQAFRAFLDNIPRMRRGLPILPGVNDGTNPNGTRQQQPNGNGGNGGNGKYLPWFQPVAR